MFNASGGLFQSRRAVDKSIDGNVESRASGIGQTHLAMPRNA